MKSNNDLVCVGRDITQNDSELSGTTLDSEKGDPKVL